MPGVGTYSVFLDVKYNLYKQYLYLVATDARSSDSYTSIRRIYLTILGQLVFVLVLLCSLSFLFGNVADVFHLRTNMHSSVHLSAT